MKAKISISMRHLALSTACLTAAGLALFAASPTTQGYDDPAFFGRKFSREENLLLGLRQGKGSAALWLLEAKNGQKAITDDIDRALNRIDAADHAYSKSKGRPDDKCLAACELRLVQAKQRSQDLEDTLALALREMRSGITETLIKNP